MKLFEVIKKLKGGEAEAKLCKVCKWKMWRYNKNDCFECEMCDNSLHTKESLRSSMNMNSWR